MRHIHVPFEALWSMRIPVPYSLFLRAGGLGWSCGQCPLDREGAVAMPDDGPAQARLVVRRAEATLRGAGMGADDLRMAVVYHDLADPEGALAILRAAFGPQVLMVPVACPAFYYPGMRIEVDLFADRGGSLRFGTGPGPGVPVIDHIAVPARTPSLPPHALIHHGLTAPVRWTVHAPGDTQPYTLHTGGAEVQVRRGDGILGLTALAPGLAGLVPQTEAVMMALDVALTEEGLSFADVVKSTTHYCGEPTPQDLHDNMAVRNRRYRSPGPASTGIRVSELAARGALTAVSLLALR